MARPFVENTLFYGDNLPILREYVADESVDLIYLDPPFNSNRTYNVLFRQEGGEEAEAQIAAFEDTWHWNRAAEETYHGLVTHAPAHVGQMIGALRGFIGENQMMAYLVMMAARLVEPDRHAAAGRGRVGRLHATGRLSGAAAAAAGAVHQCRPGRGARLEQPSGGQGDVCAAGDGIAGSIRKTRKQTHLSF